PQEVKSLESGRFGDEPVLMKSKLDVPVFVGPKKNETAKMVSDLKKVDVIVVDDGFQHRKLSRDLDIVLVDTTMEPELFTLLPSGNLREPIENLARADVVVLTKCNLSENLEWYRKTVAQYSELVLESDFEVSLPKKRAFPVGPKVVCVSGIGNPRQFEESVKKLLKPSKIQTIRFPDHHRFTDADIRRIQRAVSGKETLCVTTEKDQIRLPEMGIDWVVPQAQFKWRKNAETEFEKLLKSRILDRQKRK
ncbi:MAG: tetraacyldisaccharide 4'-kinase, partial [Bdellovibrionales bacterium]|nr:tetraacyldisaccharide 4'-kinase [Bdellovibrionales bacterium]